MHPSFGSFMPYQGGHYGMATLSRHPIIDAVSLRLPKGNEPRVALITTVRLPNQSVIAAVNVHFDWVENDTLRFAQAKFLADHLRTLTTPYVLLGDFNDQPDSRTLSLFGDIAAMAKKPANARLTYPSDAPGQEIDFIFAAPQGKWGIDSVVVIEEKYASDHRPVLAELHLRTH